MAPFIFGVVGRPVMEKLNFMEDLTAELLRRGYRVGTVRQEPVGDLMGLMGEIDLILAEGFAGSHWPKLEVYEGARGPLVAGGDPWLVAVVGQVKPRRCPVPFFMTDETERIVDMIEATLSLGTVARS